MKRLDFETLNNLIEQKLSYKQISAMLNVSQWRVMQDCKFYNIRSLAGNNFTQAQLSSMQEKKKQCWQQGRYNNRKSLSLEDKCKISQTVKQRWAEGAYSERQNGMLHKTKLLAPNYKPQNNYREKLFFINEQKCFSCGRNDVKIDVHHMDEDRQNYLLSNLTPLCVHCHQKQHLKIYNPKKHTKTYKFNLYSKQYVPVKCLIDLPIDCYSVEITVVYKNENLISIMDKNIDSVISKIQNIFDYGYLGLYLPYPEINNILYTIWIQCSVFLKGIESICINNDNVLYKINKKQVLKQCLDLKIESHWLLNEKDQRHYLLNNSGITFIQFDLEDVYNPVILKYNNKIKEE